MEETVEKAGENVEDVGGAVNAPRPGWMDRDEWISKGFDPQKWIDAKEYEERADKILPLRNAEYRKLKAEVDEMKRTQQAFIAHQRKVTENEIAKRLAELRVEKKEALESADYDKVLEIDDNIDQLKEAKKTSTETKQQAPPEVASFVERNKGWFGIHADATTDARMFSAQYRSANPDSSVEDELAYVEKKIKKEYPEYFTAKPEPHGNSAPTVESGNGSRPTRGKNSFADLPQEAKAEFAAFARMGAFKDDEAGRKKYAAEYFGN